MPSDDTTPEREHSEPGTRSRMPLSAWVAVTAGILGFFVKFSFLETTSEGGQTEIFFRDYGAITAGIVALAFGGWAVYRILSSPLKKNLAFVVIALFLGVVHLIRGFVAFGGEEAMPRPRMRNEFDLPPVRVEFPRESERRMLDRASDRPLRKLASRGSSEFQDLLSKAESGDGAAQLEVGRRYAEGTGVPTDLDAAFEWIRRAAENGEVAAMKDLGVMYKQGIGTAKDPVEAFEWTQKAAEMGNLEGMENLAMLFLLGVGVEKDLTSSARWFKKAAEQGHTNAQFNYGAMLANGDGVERNLPEAIQWYEKAVNKGSVKAMVNLGVMYMDGIGVQKDPARAVELFNRAAKEGVPNAYYLLGLCFEDGVGVEKDPVKARAYLQRAADQGFEPAIEHLKTLKP